MNVAQETLGLRRAGLSPALSLLMSAFALPIPPAGFTPHLHRPTERSPTIQTLPSARSTRNLLEQTPPTASPRQLRFARPLLNFASPRENRETSERAQVERLNP